MRNNLSEFCVQSKDFLTYQRFRREVEAIGWIYNRTFGHDSFSAGAMEVNDCLYFSNDWSGETLPMFAFSNAGNNVVGRFNLDTTLGYKLAVQRSAVEFNKTIINERQKAI